MPLDFYKAGSNVLNAYEKEVGEFLDTVLQGEPIYIPVDTMGLRQIRDGASFDDAQASSARLYTVQADGSVVSAEIAIDAGQQGNITVRGIRVGEASKRIVECIRHAAESKDVAALRYRVRLLTVPSLFLEALRLTHQQNGSELIVPVAVGDPRLASKELFPRDEFLTLLRQLATERLLKDQGPSKPSLSS